MRTRNPWATAFALVVMAVACDDPRNDPRPEPRTPGSKPVTATATGTSSAPGPAKPSTLGEQALKEIDTTKLNDRERAEVAGQLDKLSAPCPDTPVTLAQCLVEKRACKACKTGAEWVASLTRNGTAAPERQQLYQERFDATKVNKVDPGKSPSKGPADAPVTIIEWADFQCGWCAKLRPYFELMLERFPGQVRVVYKYYKINVQHERALEAAYAAQAAHNQGKFWEMHKVLFDNQETGLERSDFSRYAKDLKLDLDKFKKDLDDPETRKIITADIKQADELEIGGTPFVIINGRKFPEKMGFHTPDAEMWIKLELELLGLTPADPTPKFTEMAKELSFGMMEAPDLDPANSASPATSGSASAGPTVSASAGPAPTASAGAGSAAPATSAPPKKPKPKPTATPAPEVPPGL